MGDRTFSADDVIRIYEFFLTPSEQETVDFFFLIPPPEEEPLDIFDTLREILETLGFLQVTLRGLVSAILVFAPGLFGLFSTITVAVANALNVLQQLIEENTSA